MQWFIYIPDEGHWPIPYKGPSKDVARRVYLRQVSRNRIPTGSHIISRSPDPGDNYLGDNDGFSIECDATGYYWIWSQDNNIELGQRRFKTSYEAYTDFHNHVGWVGEVPCK